MLRKLRQGAIVPWRLGVLQALRRMLEVASYEFNAHRLAVRLFPGHCLSCLRLSNRCAGWPLRAARRGHRASHRLLAKQHGDLPAHDAGRRPAGRRSTNPGRPLGGMQRLSRRYLQHTAGGGEKAGQTAQAGASRLCRPSSARSASQVKTCKENRRVLPSRFMFRSKQIYT